MATNNTPSTETEPQSAAQNEATGAKRTSRRKRAIQEVTESEPSNPPPENNPDTDVHNGRNKKRKEQNAASQGQQNPETPAFDPQTPSFQTATPSFLQAYISSPTPRSDHSNLTLGTLNIGNLQDNEDTSETTPPDDPQSDEEEPLEDRLIAAKERSAKVNTNPASARDPMEKYTQPSGQKIGVYYSHPMAAFDNIDVDQILNWKSNPGGKLLAHPFGNEVRTADAHADIKKKVFAAVIEITKSNEVGFSAPKPSSSLGETPTAFLIYNLTNEQRQTLLHREIWSSKAVTFRVTPMSPARPNFLFSISGFTSQTNTEVREAVLKTWLGQDSIKFLTDLSQSFPARLRNKAEKILEDVVNSVKVAALNTKDPGDINAPTFNVYIQASLIPGDELWCRFRNYYAEQEYALPFQEPGQTSANLFHCTICHSVDHPRGLCKYPELTGWNGPSWRTQFTKRDTIDKPRNKPFKIRRNNWADFTTE